MNTFYWNMYSVQLLNHVQLFATPWTAAPWTAALQASLSSTNSRSLLKLMFIELVMPSNHLILSFPSLPAFNLAHHQGLFQWVSSSHQVASYWSFNFSSVLPINIQDWFPLGYTDLISLQSKGLSRAFSNTTVQKHQFFGAQLSL